MNDIDKRVKELKVALKNGLGHKGPWHDRLPEFEIIDRVTMEIVPRYKTSGLSGDEWRQSVKIVGYFKGVVVFEERCNDMSYATGVLYKWCHADGAIPKSVIAKEEDSCDQPSCMNKATNKYLMKKIHSKDCMFEKDAMKASMGKGYYRQFCDIHAERGDCGLNDADRNYKPITGGPKSSTNNETSPSGGPITVDLT